MPRSSRSPNGFTLLEVLLALVLFGIGVLGLAGSAGLVSRLVGNGSRMTVAATVALTRFEQLRSLPCAQISAGSATTRNIEERWATAPLGSGPLRALQVELSVTYRLRAPHARGTERTERFTGAMPCRDA